VVFLDQDAVVQAHALILPAAHPHRVFLGDAQAGQGFSGIQNRRMGAAHGLDIGPGGGGHRRQGLQEIQRRAFGGQQRARIAVDVGQHVAGRHGVALVDPPLDGATEVERLETGVEPGPAGDHRGFAGDDAGAGGLHLGDEPGGEVINRLGRAQRIVRPLPLEGVTSDLSACGLSRMTSSSIRGLGRG